VICFQSHLTDKTVDCFKALTLGDSAIVVLLGYVDYFLYLVIELIDSKFHQALRVERQTNAFYPIYHSHAGSFIWANHNLSNQLHNNRRIFSDMTRSLHFPFPC
jgi:hypothetical protein